jgi:hypothetical protein
LFLFVVGLVHDEILCGLSGDCAPPGAFRKKLLAGGTFTILARRGAA